MIVRLDRAAAPSDSCCGMSGAGCADDPPSPRVRLEAAPDSVVIVNHTGRIDMVNAQTESIFGYSRAELLGQPVEMLIPERLHAAHVRRRDSYQKNPSVRAMGLGRNLLARRKVSDNP